MSNDRALIPKCNRQRTVPSSEEVMIEQIFVNDELAFLKKERELFRDYEGESISENINTNGLGSLIPA